MDSSQALPASGTTCDSVDEQQKHTQYILNDNVDDVVARWFPCQLIRFPNASFCIVGHHCCVSGCMCCCNFACTECLATKQKLHVTFACDARVASHVAIHGFHDAGTSTWCVCVAMIRTAMFQKHKHDTMMFFALRSCRIHCH